MKRIFDDFRKYFKYASYAAFSELKAEISSSYLGWLWWIIEPLFLLILYMFVFGYIFRSSVKYFSLFIFIGITIWLFFNITVSSSVRLVHNNKHILSKVYLPKYMLVIKKMLVNAFKMNISFLLILATMFIMNIPISKYMLWVFPLFILLYMFTFAFSTFILHIGIYLDDLQKIINIFLRTVLFLSGIFYSIEERIGHVSDTMSIILQKVNPVAFLITSFRDVMIYSKPLSLEWYFIWMFLSLFFAGLSIRLVYKYEDDYIKVI